MDRPSELEAVLEPLYAAVLNPGRLAEFSATLCAATGSHIGAVMAHDAGNAHGRLELLVGADPAYMAAYEREFAADNPWMQRTAHLMRPGIVMDSDAVLSRSELRRTRYYNEYLRIGDIEQSLALCAQADGEGVVVATLCRPSGTPYSQADLALARQVAPHWSNAYAILRRMSWLERQARTLEAAVEASPLAMLMLDAHGCVIRLNPAAEHLLSHGDVLRLANGRPDARHDPQPFRHLLHDAIAGTAGNGHAARRAGKLLLRNANGQGVLVADVHPIGDAGGLGAAAVVFLQPVGAPAADGLAATLRQLFGLTPSEAALAVALLRHGDLAPAAVDCHITTGTAQTRLKLVYDKTGVHGQVVLMRLLASVAAATGRTNP